MKHRKLTHEEIELWRVVTATVQPLVPRKSEPIESRPQVQKMEPGQASVLPNFRIPVRPAQKPLGEIERRTRRDLLKGRVEVDARLDLHGNTLAEAHQRVTNFLTNSQGRGARFVLIVTGKGKNAGSAQGPLRRQTPMWLADPRLRHIVAAFGEASPAHGGAGALYVRLRRRRDHA